MRLMSSNQMDAHRLVRPQLLICFAISVLPALQGSALDPRGDRSRGLPLKHSAVIQAEISGLEQTTAFGDSIRGTKRRRHGMIWLEKEFLRSLKTARNHCGSEP
jgi:hypothetical protein